MQNRGQKRPRAHAEGTGSAKMAITPLSEGLQSQKMAHIAQISTVLISKDNEQKIPIFVTCCNASLVNQAPKTISSQVVQVSRHWTVR